jgi:Kef-type K+ transport system membrane component KefB
VILLLFEVGLESTLAQMARVGWSALLVATLGVVAPLLLGIGVGAWLLPSEPFYMHLFLGAILTATSVGITARVLSDLGAAATPEARVILGAAVIDDVLGLVVLAAVTAIVGAADAGIPVGWGALLGIVGKTLAFLVVAMLLGVFVAPRVLARLARLRGTGVMLGFTLAFCFALAWGASAVGLAPIVGAFAAGLVLETAHYEPFHSRGERQVEELIHPIVQFLAPVFFVLMGFRVDLSTFAQVDVLLLAGALTVAGVVGKQVCALGVVDRGIRRLPVALGMIPRGEVGLIFASVGARLTYGGEPLVSPAVFSATVIVVITTTLVTPPLLTRAMRPVLAG